MYKNNIQAEKRGSLGQSICFGITATCSTLTAACVINSVIGAIVDQQLAYLTRPIGVIFFLIVLGIPFGAIWGLTVLHFLRLTGATKIHFWKRIGVYVIGAMLSFVVVYTPPGRFIADHVPILSLTPNSLFDPFSPASNWNFLTPFSGTLALLYCVRKGKV